MMGAVVTGDLVMRMEVASDAGLVQLVAWLSGNGADGKADLGALLREVESRYPGEIQRMASALTCPTLRETPARPQ